MSRVDFAIQQQAYKKFNMNTMENISKINPSYKIK